MDLASFIQSLIDDGSLALVRDNSAAQFGPRNTPYLGATILPERTVESNFYEEAGIQYRTVIANSGTRYSPVQLKSGGRLVGTFDVKLAHQDIGLQMDARDYDALVRLLASKGSMEQMASMVLKLANQAVAGLAMLNEKMRWDAMVTAQIVLKGDNGYSETVSYSNPASHRAAAGGDWTSDSYDPYEDILERAQLLTDKGYSLKRIVMSSKVATIFARNAKVAQRFAPVRVLSNADLFGRIGLQDINVGFQSDGLPPIETYDARWYDQETNGRMLSDSVAVFIAETDDNQVINTVNGDVYLPDTAGYYAIGIPTGQATPGRTLVLDSQSLKPPSILAESWQTTLPVITHPQAIAVLTGIGV